MATGDQVAAPKKPAPTRAGPPQWKPRPRGFWHSVLYIAERLAKEPVFRCQMCGQCILHNCAYCCPMRCPKRLRNGPCGGYDLEGHCEVFPERDCAWLRIYRWSGRLRKMDEYTKERQPLDHGLNGTSSWFNLLVTRTIDLDGRTHRKLPQPDD